MAEQRTTSDGSSGGGFRVSVVIPVFNGARTIREAIAHVLKQSLKPVEILVVDDGSTDGTPAIVDSFGGSVRRIAKVNGGPASARNIGIREAIGELVAFTDSDCLPSENWLAEIVQGFDDPKVAGVGGSVRGYEPGFVGWFVDETHMLEPMHNGKIITFVVTANACFRRSALIEAGLFDERFRKPGGEEPELCKRLRDIGYEFRFRPGALVLHHHKQTMKVLLKTLANYGEGRAIMESIWPETKGDIAPWRELIGRIFDLTLPAKRVILKARKYGIFGSAGFAMCNYAADVAYHWGYFRATRRLKEARP